MRRIIVLLVWGVLAISAPAQLQPSSKILPEKTQPAAAPNTEAIQTFLPLALQLSWNNRRWQIMDGKTVLKDFGTREREARQALQMIKEMGVNQHGTIGSPNPVMEYWLINGKAPQWLPRGSLCVKPLEPAKLHVDEVQGQWCLRDNTRVLFSFGGQEDQARLALHVIQKYGFIQVGSVGIGAPLMYVFFGRADVTSPGMPPSLTGNVTPTHLTTTHFSTAAKNSDGTPRVENITSSLELLRAAPAVLPPLAPTPDAGDSLRANPSANVPMRMTLNGQPTPLWREQPHFGPRANPIPAAGADRVPFDWRQVQLRLDNGEWKLESGSLVLGRFGKNDHDARAALSAIRYYRFTEQWRPGGGGDANLPRYFVANAQAPKGLMLGLPGRPFNPEQVQVGRIESGYAVTDGQIVLIEFGSHQQEAERLMQAIKHDKLDEICTVGREGKESMTFFLRSK